MVEGGGSNMPCGAEGRDYLDLSGTSISVEAATIAGAMTMPIKARAIKRSYIVFLSLRVIQHVANEWIIFAIRSFLNTT
jgi:hypothetical protein